MANKTINQYSALTSPATDDYVLIWDTSAGATKKIAFSQFDVNLATLINGYSTLVSPATDDLIAVLDISTGLMKKVTADQFSYDLAAEVTGATALSTPDSTDEIPILDVSAGTIKAMPYSTLSGNLKADGSVALTANWDIGAGFRISGEQYRARSAAGLRLEEDSGGLGIYIEDSSGNVGIGTATLTGAPRLTVDGSIRAGYDTDSTSVFGRASIGYDGLSSDIASFAHVDQHTSANYALRQDAAGTTRINTPAGNSISLRIGDIPYFVAITHVFYPNTDNASDLGSASKRWDDIYATNGTIQTSDPRLKADITQSDLGLAFIRALEPLRYRFSDGKRPHYGLSATQVRRALDELQIADFAGYIRNEKHDAYGLRYTEFIAPIVAAIQELAERLDALEAA